MEEALSKIRPHTTSSLAHQKAPATLLRALESTLSEQGAERTPTTYFAALVTTVDGTLKGGSSGSTPLALGDGDLLPAELYLLALVAPYVPHPVLRAHLSTLLSLTAPLFPELHAHAPPLRSLLSIYTAFLPALDRAHLDAPGVRQAFFSVLHLTLDPRPKVRRRAAEVIQDVLAHPPAPLARHPYAERVADWAANALKEAAASPIGKHKGKKTQKVEGDASDAAIHLIAFLRMVVPYLPPSSWPTITTHLLSLPRLGNPYLSQSAYSLLSSLLSSPSTPMTVGSSDEPTPRPLDLETLDLTPQLPSILKAVLSSPPSKSDNTLAPSWLVLLGHTILVMHDADEVACTIEIPKAWKAAWTFVDNGDGSIRAAAAQCLELISGAFTPEFVAPALKEASTIASNGDAASVLGRIIVQLTKAFDQLSFASSIPQLLSILASLLSALRPPVQSPLGGQSPAELLLLPLVIYIANLRTKKTFEHKEAVDRVLGVAMAVLGPHVVLSPDVLPLNLEPIDRAAGKEPRAFLLPLLQHAHPSPLAHFVSYFVPLSERMFDLQGDAEMAGREAEAKVWSVMIGQVWSGLIGYCHVTRDLPTGLTPVFAQLLSQLLYSQPDLRPAVLRALKVMVESNVVAASSIALNDDEAGDNGSKIIADKNLTFLRSQASSWLAVLFNVFGTTARDARTTVGEVIASWITVTSEQDLAQAYGNILNLFKSGLKGSDPSVVSATQDLLLLLLPNLGAEQAQELFAFLLEGVVLKNKDNGVQKRAYKIIGKLVESRKFAIDAEKLLGQLDDASEGLQSAAKKDRMHLLGAIVETIESDKLHLIPALIPETVLGLKEPSEKARAEAFQLVVKMGHRMKEGGTVKRAEMGDMDEDDVEDASASLEEYVTMLAGGLAGATPHMISASVTALSRVVFEFRDDIPTDMHAELFTTLVVFLQSANREIVKSVLGYVKLVIHTLPVELLRPHLGALVPALLGWAHPGKNAFKLKVRHTFERMIRRFGWEDVYAAAGEEGGRKVLINIRKRKERAKKKRVAQAAAQEDEDEDEIPRGKPASGDAFEDVLYGSESELDSDDDEEAPARPTSRGQAQNSRATHGVRLRVDDDEPMDLLHGAVGAMATRTDKRRKPGQDADKFKTDEDTGRMIIDEDDADSDDPTTATTGDAIAGGAYHETLTSADGFTRGANGRIKFNKDTKKRRRDNADVEDVEMGSAATATQGPSPGKKAKSRQEPRFGSEFKAKKAGGDVKRGGVDPYAYMTLSQASKKKGGKNGRIGITNK